MYFLFVLLNWDTARIRTQPLRQVKIKFDDRYPGHIDFTHPPFLPLLPFILDEIDTWYAQVEACVHSPREIRLALNIKTH